MSQNELMRLNYSIYLDYAKEMLIFFCNEPDDFCSYLKSRRVCLPADTFSNPTVWSVFAFLHEVGHIKTNTTKMKRYEQEYHATQWAIKEAKRRGFKVPKNIINIYQKYIWKWRETSIKHKAKNVCAKEDLRLTF